MGGECDQGRSGDQYDRSGIHLGAVPRQGPQDYFRYVNETKGGVAGRKIEMILVDTGYKVPEAVAAVRKFAVQDKVDMIATWGAGEGLAAKPIIQKYKIPTINYSTSWEILEPPVAYMYLPFGSYRMDCYAVLEYIKAIHKGKEAPKVGLLTYNNAYGRSIHEPSQEYARIERHRYRSRRGISAQDGRSDHGTSATEKSGAEYVFMQMLPSDDRHGPEKRRPHQLRPAVPRHLDLDGSGFLQARAGHHPGPAAHPVPGRAALRQFAGDESSCRSSGSVTRPSIKFDASYWEGVVVGMIMERAFVRAQEKYKDQPRDHQQGHGVFRERGFRRPDSAVSPIRQGSRGSFKARIVRVQKTDPYRP